MIPSSLGRLPLAARRLSVPLFLLLFACDVERADHMSSVQADDGSADTVEDSAANRPDEESNGSSSKVDAALDSETAESDSGAPDASDADATPADTSLPDGNAPDGSVPDATVPLLPLASGDGVALPFRVVDAEYSDALNRIVIVAAEPNRLIVLDPEAGTHSALTLPLTPSSVSVRPDGLVAAVGHNGYVSIIELSPLRLQHTRTVSTDVSDVVLAGNGYAYAMPRVDQWEEIHSLEIASGVETLGGSIRAGTVARLHPAGDKMYGADRGLSPADIERYDISKGTATVAYDSPYHGDHAMCGELWFSQDGARIFTACGNVFRASNVRQDDMKYNGALEGNPSVRSLDHSTAAKLVAVVHRGAQFTFPGDPVPTSARELSVFEDQFLGFRQKVTLPKFKAGNTEYHAEGRFVFFNALGTRVYVLVEAESAAPLVNNFGLARFTVGGSAGASGTINGQTGQTPAVDPPATVGKGTMLGVHIVDAEYSRALDRIVAVTSSLNRLLILNPSNATSVNIELPLPAAAVSLHAAGKLAAVGHDGWISLVDLTTNTITKTLAVSADLNDVVYGANGYVYGFPARDQWSSIHAVHIASSVETLSGAATIYAGTVARMHPAGDRMYGANRGLSPSDIERYDVSTGPVTGAHDSPYHGDFAMCGNLWFSEDGARIFTACSNVFRASNVPADDMRFNGALQGALSIEHLDHSAAAQRVAAVLTAPSADVGVALFEDQFLNRVGSLALPAVVVAGKSYTTKGRFAFFNAAGTQLYVLAEAASAPLVGNSVLVSATP